MCVLNLFRAKWNERLSGTLKLSFILRVPTKKLIFESMKLAQSKYTTNFSIRWFHSVHVSNSPLSHHARAVYD